MNSAIEIKDEKKYIITKWEGERTLANKYPLDLYVPTFSFLSRHMILTKARLLSKYSDRCVCSQIN